MATTTRVLTASVNGTVYTTNANGALEAIDTCHSGASAPTDEVANGKFWLDTTTTPGILKIYNNATWEVVHSGTVDINAGAIDGTVIGGTTPAAVTGTALTATGAFTSLGIDDNAAATAVTIAASGNVGIGAAAPNTKLTVSYGDNATTAERLVGRFYSYDATPLRGLEIYNGIGGNRANGLVRLNAESEGATGVLAFDTDGTERMRVDGSGNVLVGKSAEDGGATEGHELKSNNIAYHTKSGNAALVLNRLASTGTTMVFKQAFTAVGTISVTASTTAYNTTSDYRLKENITPVQGAGDIIKAMQPVTYNFKANKSEWQDGFLAHELQMLQPYAVTGEKDKMKEEEYEIEPAEDEVLDEDGKVVKPAKKAKKGIRTVDDVQMVDYSKLTPLLTAALQEALGKIEVLEAQNAAFETRLAALEATP